MEEALESSSFPSSTLPLAMALPLRAAVLCNLVFAQTMRKRMVTEKMVIMMTRDKTGTEIATTRPVETPGAVTVETDSVAASV